MEEELEMVFDVAKEQMDAAVEHLKKELLKIRTGRANPVMLDGIRVDYYGSKTPLSQISNINTPDAHTILIQPWEKGLLGEIEKAIINSNIGLNPQNNGEVIIMNVPPLTEERRREFVKNAKNEGETGKISVRTARHDALAEIKRLKTSGMSEDIARDAEEEIQKRVDAVSKRIDSLLAEKEVEIMKV